MAQSLPSGGLRVMDSKKPGSGTTALTKRKPPGCTPLACQLGTWIPRPVARIRRYGRGSQPRSGAARIAVGELRRCRAAMVQGHFRARYARNGSGMSRSAPMPFSRRGCMSFPIRWIRPCFATTPSCAANPICAFMRARGCATRAGLPLGTLCVLDYESRPQGLDAHQERTSPRTFAQRSCPSSICAAPSTPGRTGSARTRVNRQISWRIEFTQSS